MNDKSELERFKNLVLEYKKIEEKYMSGTQITHQKKDALLWELDALRDEICFARSHLNNLLKRKDKIMQLITTPDAHYNLEKDESLKLLLHNNSDLTYKITVSDFINELVKEINVESRDVVLNVSIGGRIEDNCFGISDYIEKAESKYGIRYNFSLPIQLHIHINDSNKEDIILSWNSSLYENINDNQRLLDLLKLDTCIINKKSYTILSYYSNPNNLVINCGMEDLFYDLMSENEEYDTIIRNSLINAIENKLEKEEKKYILL